LANRPTALIGGRAFRFLHKTFGTDLFLASVSYHSKKPTNQSSPMTFFRVYGGPVFGDFVKISSRLDVSKGDVVSDVFGTPHKACAAYMVTWNHAKFSVRWGRGGNSAQRILTVDTDDFYRPTDVSDNDPRTDKDQVVIRNGTVVSVSKPSDFFTGRDASDFYSAWNGSW
jgi:hypothetical protein